MTFKEYVNIKNSPNRLLYRLFLKLKEDEPIIMLKHSLVFDGRFYGAEFLDP
jgi:hypothetical protein